MPYLNLAGGNVQLDGIVHLHSGVRVPIIRVVKIYNMTHNFPQCLSIVHDDGKSK